MARVAVEIQESLRHNFGQLARPLESIGKSHLLRRSLAPNSFSVVNTSLTSSLDTQSTSASEPGRLARIEEWLEQKRNLNRTTERLSWNTMG